MKKYQTGYKVIDQDYGHTVYGLYCIPLYKTYVGQTVASPHELYKRIRKGNGYQASTMAQLFTQYPFDDNWEIRILAEGLTKEAANFNEAYYIAQMGDLNTAKPIFGEMLKNKEYADIAQQALDNEDKDLLRQLVKQYYQRDIRPPQRAVEQLKDGAIIATYSSIVEAHEATGIDKGNISACCNERRKRAGGYEWKYAKEDAKSDR